MTPRPSESAETVLAHVLFMDVIGSELLGLEQQSAIYRELTELVRQTAEFRRAAARGEVISRPAGDGMALVFLSGPDAPLCCALELASHVRERSHLNLRMGVHSGTVSRVQDINGIEDVTGEGIITARRVMDCGDAGHILVSAAAAETAEKIPAWAEMLHFLGVCEVKHGRRLALWSLYTPEVGNPKAPRELIDQLAEATLAPHRMDQRVSGLIREIAVGLVLITVVAMGIGVYRVFGAASSALSAISFTVAALAVIVGIALLIRRLRR